MSWNRTGLPLRKGDRFDPGFIAAEVTLLASEITLPGQPAR